MIHDRWKPYRKQYYNFRVHRNEGKVSWIYLSWTLNQWLLHSAVTLITWSVWWNISPQAPLQIDWIQNLCKWRICISRVPTDNSAEESGFSDDFVGTGKSLSPRMKRFTFGHMCSSSVELLRIALFLWILKVLHYKGNWGSVFWISKGSTHNQKW